MIRVSSGFLYVYHKATTAEQLRMIGNGYRPYEWELERDPLRYQYARGELAPLYPLPVLR
jgi:hypothetical protein